MSCAEILYKNCSNVIELADLTNDVTGVVDTTATVTVTLIDSGGNEVTGQTWPATMAHVAAGLYRATLEDDIDINDRQPYTAVIDITGTGGEIDYREIPATCKIKRS